MLKGRCRVSEKEDGGGGGGGSGPPITLVLKRDLYLHAQTQ